MVPQKCKIKQDDKYNNCNVGSKDIEHLFWHRSLVNSFWMQIGVSLSGYGAFKGRLKKNILLGLRNVVSGEPTINITNICKIHLYHIFCFRVS